MRLNKFIMYVLEKLTESGNGKYHTFLKTKHLCTKNIAFHMFYHQRNENPAIDFKGLLNIRHFKSLGKSFMGNTGDKAIKLFPLA